MISLQISLTAGVEGLLRPEHLDAINGGGGLDPEQVYFEYVTMHDDKVRPSHAALDGSIWRVDDPFAPVPPIAYGCRCCMRYVAKPQTIAAEILPPTTATVQTKAYHFAKALDDKLPEWKAMAANAAKLRPDLRFAYLQSELRSRYDAAIAKDLALMILEASRKA